jgi:hypothetical protein
MRKTLIGAALLLAIAAPALADDTAFKPVGSTVSLAVTGTTGRVQIQTSVSAASVRVYNSGTVAVFMQCGDVTVTATTTTSLPILPGTAELIGCGQQYVAAITAGTAATIYLTPGNGL